MMLFLVRIGFAQKILWERSLTATTARITQYVVTSREIGVGDASHIGFLGKAVRIIAIVVLVVSASANCVADELVELFADDFSRFSPGPLTSPVGKLGGAIQEYHYLAHRGVPLGPWANAICHIDAWVAGEEDGKPYLEQQLPPTHKEMTPKLFAPIFLTGGPEWCDYLVEASVCPLAKTEFAGIVFRYHTNRHHYLFCLEDGKSARLAVRLPLEAKYRVCSWKELGRVDFPYETNHYYKLRVENEGPEIRAYIDDRLVLTAKDESILRGKVGISANVPARFQDFRVRVKPETRQLIATAIVKRETELSRLQAENPRAKLWKRFETPKFGAGRNVRFGDLDGDGQLDMLIGQNVPKVERDSAVELSCLTAVTLDGKLLWQVGRPDPRNGLLTCDTPFQIHDLDEPGRSDVVLAKDFRLQVLDGRTGKVKRSAPTPEIAGYPEDVPQKPPEILPYERANGDSLAFANFSGAERATEIIIKDRYWNFWVYDRALKPLWSGQGMLGHYPFPVRDAATGQDRLAIGYAMWDGAGKQLWSNDSKLHQHADSVYVGNLSDDASEPERAFYCGSDDGVIVVDHRGVVRRQVLIGHAQTAAVGKFRSDLPGLQYVTVNFWRNPGIISLFDEQGELILQEEPTHYGSPLQPVNWRGDGLEFILLGGNVREGGMLDGELRRVVMFPDDGHPDLCATALVDLTGDARDEIVLWDQASVWIYTQDKPFSGERIYAPQRNPHCNDSNYRVGYSHPAWKVWEGGGD
jgi:rhamnogalacturonan endolyase